MYTMCLYFQAHVCTNQWAPLQCFIDIKGFKQFFEETQQWAVYQYNIVLLRSEDFQTQLQPVGIYYKPVLKLTSVIVYPFSQWCP